MDCENLKDDLIDVLYGEASATARQRVEKHTATCTLCRSEIDGLRAVRRDLPAWTLPAGVAGAPRRQWAAPRPALAWAASLLLAFAGGIALAGGGLARENGRVDVAPAEARLQKILDEQEARHQAEIQAVRSRAALPGDDVLRHVERLVAEAEDRQARRLDGQLVEFARRVDGQRRDDMARVSAGLSLLEGQTNHDLARATELMGYVLQATHEEAR